MLTLHEIYQWPEYHAALKKVPAKQRIDYNRYVLPAMAAALGDRFTADDILPLTQQYVAALEQVPAEWKEYYTHHAFPALVAALGDKLTPELLQQYVAALKQVPEEEESYYTHHAFPALVAALGDKLTPELLQQYVAALEQVPAEQRSDYTRYILPAMVRALGDRFTADDILPLTQQYVAALKQVPAEQKGDYTEDVLPAIAGAMGDDLDPDSCGPYFRAVASLFFLDSEWIKANAHDLWIIVKAVTDDAQLTKPVILKELLGENQLTGALAGKEQLREALQRLCAPKRDQSGTLDHNHSFKDAVDLIINLKPNDWGAVQGLTETYGAMGAFAAAAALSEYKDITGIDAPFTNLPKLVKNYIPRQAVDYLRAIAKGVILPAIILQAMENGKDYHAAIMDLKEKHGDYESLTRHCQILAAEHLFNEPHQLFAGSNTWHQGGAMGALALRRWDPLPIPDDLGASTAQSDIPADGKIVLVPLCESRALASESAALNHCVGWSSGYVDACTIGEEGYYSHLLSMRMIFPKGTDMQAVREKAGTLGLQPSQVEDDPVLGPHLVLSTAQLYENAQRKLSVVQHHGYNNGKVDPACTATLNKYLKKFNKTADQRPDYWARVEETRNGFRAQTFETFIQALLGREIDCDSLRSNLDRTLSGRGGTLGATLPKRTHGADSLKKLMGKLNEPRKTTVSSLTPR